MKTDKRMDKVFYRIPIEINILENLKIIILMDKEIIFGPIKHNTTDNGKMAKKKAMEHIFLLTELS